jgi:basic membrane lipoprotein Med (substrate-binding protein (PBP1-ABC) superfamily)
MNSRGISRTLLVVILAVIMIVAAFGAVAYYYLYSPTQQNNKEFQVGIVLYGHRDLGSWDPTMSAGITDLVSQGLKIKPVFSEEVQIIDAEDVLRNRASVDDLVYVSTYIYQDAVLKVAKEFPDKPFILQQDVYSTADDLYKSGNLPSNVLLFSNEQTFVQSLYIQGLCAASMTHTNKVGFVLVDNSPGSAAQYNAVRQGLFAINPNIETPYVIIGTWSDPIATRDAITTLVGKGCDIIYNGMDDEAADEGALNNNILSLHVYRDVRSTYPNTVLADSVWTMAGYLKGPVQSVIDGAWKQYWQTSGIGQPQFSNQGVDVTYGTMVPDSVINYCNDAKNSIINGTLSLHYNLEWPSS